MECVGAHGWRRGLPHPFHAVSARRTLLRDVPGRGRIEGGPLEYIGGTKMPVSKHALLALMLLAACLCRAQEVTVDLRPLHRISKYIYGINGTFI